MLTILRNILRNHVIVERERMQYRTTDYVIVERERECSTTLR
jgi:hypothetical protein